VWSLQRSVPRPWRLALVALLGALAAAGVAYATSGNPQAAPPHAAVLLRVLIIGTFVGVGVYAATDPAQARMGLLLIAVGFYASIWLLNGSAASIPFSVGMLAAGLSPTVFAFVMLAHPTGRLSTDNERRFVIAAGGVLMACWTLLVLTNGQPPLRTPLLRCSPHCPDNPFVIVSTGTSIDSVVKAAISFTWTLLALGPPIFIWQRIRSASASLRRALVPVELAAVATAVLWLLFFAVRTAGSSTTTFGALYVGVAVTIPLAMLVGLAFERLFMGRALAEFTTELVQSPRTDPALLMAKVLGDLSLSVAYRRPAGGHVDYSGQEVAAPEPTAWRAVAWIERDGRPIAAVSYDAKLENQAGFVQAAGAAAMMRLEAAQLEADLRASRRELAASRIRLMEAADAERQRIERDIHDGVQQQLVALRIRLDLAGEEIDADPARGRQMVSAIGHQMDDLIATLRALARGIYPSLLTERGLADALRSATQLGPVPASFRAGTVGRYAEDVEVAVYFCCLEAIQNVVKHAGRDAHMVVRLWEEEGRLRFEVNDQGDGFDAESVKLGSGLTNMRDRIEAVGGSLAITSHEHHGTVVRGEVPILRPGDQPTGI
jgi:signal transduction histidine kinase